MPPPLKVMVLYGTRPEAIKLAPLTRALQDDPGCEPVIVSTGQHQSLLRSTNVSMTPPPSVEFSICRPVQSVTSLTQTALRVAAEAVELIRPDVVAVHGDTTTAMAGALAAYFQQRPVVHVEAGLRTADRYSPFPEEMNRRLISRIAELHLAPTASAMANLLAEGIPPGDIAVTGNLVVDALFEVLGREPHFTDPRIAHAFESSTPIVLFTMHRRESWGDRMAQLAASVREFCLSRPDATLVVPVHPSPAVRSAMDAGLRDLPTAIVCEPLPYTEFVHVLKQAALVVTDSGGIQEEATTLGKTVLVLRDNTERPEGADEGFLHVVGRDPQRLAQALHEAFGAAVAASKHDRTSLVYGDGKAANRCLSAILARWRSGARIADFTNAA
ncbi:non-hydrolyzing UDP-N-acetylglucosamine 2-epimerase [Plantactinospora sp. CA-294935]|uniref:non-hydrolyzing UDP-N-acetylglucosamine 2-epimerase n=1 Tax=Plantactinospora sp. CA-294935 TaxID=3240012 RepID=UPI003D949E58